MKIDLSIFKKRSFWYEVLIIALGIISSSAAIYYFLLPSKLVLGSISGVGIIINSVLEPIGIHMKVSTIITLLNVFLLIVAYFTLGAEVGLKTVVVSLLLGPCMDLLELVCPYTSLIPEGQTSIMGDPLVDLLAFVLLVGVSQACLFRINASTGGIDVIALVMHKYLHMEIGAAMSIAGIIICCCAGIIHPFNMVVFGIIGTWFNGVLVDFFTTSLNKRKRVCIISQEHEKIREYIITELKRGCSLYDVVGGYSMKEGVEIQALLTQSEFAKLMEFMRVNGIENFTTAGNCSEVYGAWRGSLR